MVELTTGDILKADVEAIVNTVNCVGVMGRGIALQFKKAYPENFKAYKAACDKGLLLPGNMLIHDRSSLINPRYIINFPTKRHWKAKSRIQDIKDGLEALIREVRKLEIRSIAVPPLGSGLGGLNWLDVRPLIESAFAALPEVRVVLFEPKGAPAPQEMPKQRKAPNMTVGKAALLCLMRRYLIAAMDPFVSLLEIHKLMYFMQEGGEPLRLKYQKALYGPYAENLRHVLIDIEGHFILGYGDGEDKPDKKIELIMESSLKAEDFLSAHPETRIRFDSVSNLINGFETPYGMELLSTVHWVVAREKANGLDDVNSLVFSWNQRKKMFPKEHIGFALRVLQERGWVSLSEDSK